jgi:hypothetical protein
MSNFGLSPEVKISRALVSQWEGVVHAGVTTLGGTDELALDMDEAKRAIEATPAACRRSANIRRISADARASYGTTRCQAACSAVGSPGYGKIAVYATIGESTDGDA